MDRREKIVEAGLAVLREHGYAGFTQLRVATLAGLRQSHLTYYYPTRLDLLGAVGQAAVDRQLVAVSAVLATAGTMDELAELMAEIICRHDNTRVLMALAQAGDDQPQLNSLFRELATGFVDRLITSPCLAVTKPSADSARLMQALVTGLAVVELATGRPDCQQRVRHMLHLAFDLILTASRTGQGTAQTQSEETL